MKKLFTFLIVFACIPFILKAQIGFDFSELASQNTSIIDALEDDGNIILLLRETLDLESISLIKLNMQGEEILRNSISVGDTHLFASNIFKQGGNYLICGSGLKITSNKIKEVFAIEVNTALEEVNSYFFTTPTNYSISKIEFAKNDDIISFAGYLSIQKLFVGEINLINSTHIFKPHFDQSGVFNAIGYDANGHLNVFGESSLYVINDQYNVQEVIDFETNNFEIQQQGDFSTINNNEILIASNFEETTSNLKGVLVGKYSSNLDIIDYDTIGLYDASSSNISIPAPVKSIALKDNKEECYIGSNEEFNPENYPYSMHNSYYMLTKYNLSTLEKEWTNTYCGDAFYMMFGLKWISDGGCLMYGFRYKPENDVIEAFALKVDENGTITGETAIPFPEIDVNIYPNPIVNSFTIELSDYKNIDLKIYNTEGKLVYQSTLKSNRTQVQLGHIASGNYTYFLSKSGKPIKVGQLNKI